MIQVDNKYVSNAIYVVGFKNPDVSIRLKQGDAERVFGSMFNAQSEQTNLPDNFDPTAARITFKSNRKSLSISQAACQIQLEFERDGIAIDEQLSAIEKNIFDFHRHLLTFKPQAELSGTALVINLNYPCSKGQDAMHEHLYKRFFVERQNPGPLASIAFQLGFKTDDNFFLNYTANVYELRAAKFDPPILATQPIRVEDVPIVEVGFGVKIDVNDKPHVALESYELQAPDRLIAVALGFARSSIDEILEFQL